MPKVHTRQAGNCLLLVDACERSYGNCFCSTSLLTFVMNTEAKTQRVHRTWFARLKMWRYAYETTVFDRQRDDVGRSEESRVGIECDRTLRSRCARYI